MRRALESAAAQDADHLQLKNFGYNLGSHDYIVVVAVAVVVATAA